MTVKKFAFNIILSLEDSQKNGVAMKVTQFFFAPAARLMVPYDC